MARLLRRREKRPDAAMVYRRAVILDFQVATGHWLSVPPPEELRGLLARWDRSEREQFYAESRRFSDENVALLRESGLWQEMTEEERQVAGGLPGEIEEQLVINATWAMESAACLLWSLGYLETLPRYDTQADLGLLELLPDGPVEALASKAALRDFDGISRARDLAELWHWRGRTRQLQEEGGLKGEIVEGQSIEEVIRLAAEEAASMGDLAETLGGDFPIFGRPYCDASADEWTRAISIAMERHQAFNWLCGYAPRNRWDEVPTDT
ncbi:MAG TPA: DUF4272 domain-containing protein [Thermoleophilia bacterium]|nr:DUF4272 domain-containing protein [Thermoleophilia bacterium]